MSSSSAFPFAAAVVSTVATALLGFASPACAAGPLASFAGYWKGGGRITLSDGSRESIRCRGTYAVNGPGDAMNIDVDCASDSYRVDLVGTIEARGGSLSGQWQETTRGVQGSVSGQAVRPGEIQANLEGTLFGIQLSARASGRHQVVAVRFDGTDVQSVAVTLKR